MNVAEKLSVGNKGWEGQTYVWKRQGFHTLYQVARVFANTLLRIIQQCALFEIAANSVQTPVQSHR
ncbi:MAG: hypothetical protein KatS3mg056_0633 [Chloroflexus sp.]|nr:MAG: hypothetical protein KatS3mg056_0633 [Chloroflexus sp.]